MSVRRLAALGGGMARPRPQAPVAVPCGRAGPPSVVGSAAARPQTPTPPHRGFGGTSTPGEVAKFGALAGQWWEVDGPMRSLHQFNQLRVGYLRGQIPTFLPGPPADEGAGGDLGGLRVLDIGCGCGILSESLARLGGRVTGLDMNPELIRVATEHRDSHTRFGPERLAYVLGSAGGGVLEGREFDVVVASEVIEHVEDRETFLHQALGSLRPGGLLAMSTLNRSIGAMAKAIVGAEYLLGVVPKGTHDWRKFLTPKELRDLQMQAARRLGREARVVDSIGIEASLNPLDHHLSFTTHPDPDSCSQYFMLTRVG